MELKYFKIMSTQPKHHIAKSRAELDHIQDALNQQPKHHIAESRAELDHVQDALYQQPMDENLH